MLNFMQKLIGSQNSRESSKYAISGATKSIQLGILLTFNFLVYFCLVFVEE